MKHSNNKVCHFYPDSFQVVIMKIVIILWIFFLPAFMVVLQPRQGPYLLFLLFQLNEAHT